MERFVAIQNDLHVVFAGLHIVEIANGITEGGIVDRGGLTGLQAIDIDAEDHLRARRERDLHARFFAGVVGEDEQQAAVERLGAALFREGDREFLCIGRSRVYRSGEEHTGEQA